MPKSKRAQVVHLTRTEKKGREGKETLYQQIRDAMDTWKYVYVISIENMRNNFLKDIREEWKNRGRLFWGRNKVMAKSLGTAQEDEYQLNSHKLANFLRGNVGLFFTNDTISNVQSYFNDFERQDYARGGVQATETVVLPAGPLMQGEDPFPSSMESQLRALGVPSRLKGGVVSLACDYTVCKEGQPLTHDQARLLKMFYKQMAVFKIKVLAYWHNGEFAVGEDEEE